VTALAAAASAVVRGSETAALRALRPERPALRRAAEAASASASRGKLWFGAAAAMALHPRLRPAARDGLVAWGAASGAAFAVKRAVERDRPRRVRALGPPVRSSSMPSSHTASAVAFAGAAALRSPATAIATVPLAAGVMWSRAATGRHFPTDVAVGAALGAGSAAAVHLAARRRDRRRLREVPGPGRDG
jgi:membrane-associated phospholipid phosphatase